MLKATATMTGELGIMAYEAVPGAAPTKWEAVHVAGIASREIPEIPVIRASDVVRISDDIDVWDSWPIQTKEGAIARICGREYWIALSAPYCADPSQRHDLARLRLLQKEGSAWRDCGLLFPDGFSPGAREWAGSAIYSSSEKFVTVFFTAAGRRDQVENWFEQRIYQTSVNVGLCGKFGTWSAPLECVCADGAIYCKANQSKGKQGEIKAFRDPSYFKDPHDGAEYLLFSGSSAASSSDYNGMIGLARANNKQIGVWNLLPPLVTADGLNNELERPHLIFNNGVYYLFWSTQRHVFNPSGVSGPNGLYGMAAEALHGPYVPLNGTGLVAANPDSEPRQAYSWLVLDSLEVVSFIDYWGLEGRAPDDDTEFARCHFGGAFAPRFSLRLDGLCAEVAGS